MNDTIPKAKRRHRRWILAAVVLLAAWFLSYRGAAQSHPVEYVGHWRQFIVPTDSQQALPELVLRGDGTGEFVWKQRRSPMTWRCEGSLLIFLHDPRSIAESFSFTLGELWAVVRGTGWHRPQLRWHVSSADESQLVLRRVVVPETTPDDSAQEEVFVRIPE